MKKSWFFLLFLAGLLALPLSNLVGLNGENNIIAIRPSASAQFAQVSTILQNKCVDCHSPNMTRMPIYSNLPIAKQLMEKDIKDARQRFVLDKKNYSGEVSFTPLMLARLENVINNNQMPPALYLSMHWNESLNQDERTTVLEWIKSERANQPWSKDSAKKIKGSQYNHCLFQQT